MTNARTRKLNKKISRRLCKFPRVLDILDLHSLMSWTREWCLPFNVEKCEVMRVAQLASMSMSWMWPHCKRCRGREILAWRSRVVWSHLCSVQKQQPKPSRHWELFKGSLVMHDEQDFHLLFDGYVCSHMEYYVQVWSPYLKKDTECLEKVQRRATKLVKGLRNKAY